MHLVLNGRRDCNLNISLQFTSSYSAIVPSQDFQ